MSFPRIGTGCFGSLGQASCQRISIASSPPMTKKISPMNRNWMPMILWSTEKMYFFMKPMS